MVKSRTACGDVDQSHKQHDVIHPTPEHILGNYEYAPFYPAALVTLSQIRGERNVVTDELKEDILFQGLQNPVDVSFINESLLDEYIGFTNRTWGSSANISDFTSLQSPDGSFPLLKSGHSRLQAVTELIAEGRLPTDSQVVARLSKANTVQDIVDWQRGENIHSQPPRERTAMALVESYQHGIEIGLWRTPKQFLVYQHERGRDASKGVLNHALKYALLPSRIRNFILAGQVPYLAGVELGSTVEVLKQFVLYSNTDASTRENTLSTVDELRIHEIVVMKLDILCSRIVEDKLNSTAAQRMIRGRRREWARLVETMRDGAHNSVEGLPFEFEQDQLERALKQQKRELKVKMTALMRRYRGADIVDFLRLQDDILSHEETEELVESFRQSTAETNRVVSEVLGAQATSSALLDGGDGEES